MAPQAPQRALTLRSGAWYGDDVVSLPLPSDWIVDVHWPRTQAALGGAEIRAALHSPVDQPRLRDALRRGARVAIVVDDLTRPTPVAAVMPAVLDDLDEAGVKRSDITVVIGTGTHGPPPPGGIEKKVGAGPAEGVTVRVHDHRGSAIRLGRTSYGTPVLVNRSVADADYTIGIGGLYPQHTTWFGGGSKLILGVLGERSIANLHYRHWGLRSRYALDNEFRRDLDEVAVLAGLRTSVIVHIDANRLPIRVACGSPSTMYGEEVRYCRDTFGVPSPEDADVVISNAYPMDTSLTFASSKGGIPLRHAREGASRVLIADCPEGNGRHGLFPLVDVPRYYYRIQWLRRQWVQRDRWGEKLRGRMSTRTDEKSETPASTVAGHPVHLFRPRASTARIDHGAAGVRVASSWEDVIQRVREEQSGRGSLRAAVYPCAPLLNLGLPHTSAGSIETLVHDASA